MAQRLTADDILSGITEQEIIELTARLVAISSESGNERPAMEAVRSWLGSHGVAVREFSRDPARPNLVATVGSSGPLLAFNGHLDTVPVADRTTWRTDPLAATREGDRLYGLATLDMKGPVAVMLLTAAALQRHAERLTGRLQLHLVSDEETGCYYGTIFMIEEIRAGRLPRPDMVLCGESSDLKVMNAERGTFKFNITFRGRPAHTAWADTDGINPIMHAARAALALEHALTGEHPDVGKGALSVNMVHGGSFPSMVPADCTLLIDRRMLPGETDESTMTDAEQIVRHALSGVPDTQFAVAPMIDANGRKRYSPPNISPWDSRIVHAVAAAHQRVTGRPAERFVGPYGATDARLYRYEGIDTVTYGPSGAHAHGSNEFVQISSLVTQLKVYVATALTVLQDEESA
jgi:acetylornithine deacetylase/succinyl-diaminopimelate desuccinylase-like protein